MYRIYKIETESEICILFSLNINIFNEYTEEMSKFFNELTKVKEKYLDNKVRNVLLVEEKSKISYKNFLKEIEEMKVKVQYMKKN